MHDYQLFSEIEKEIYQFNYTTGKLHDIAIKIECIEKKLEKEETEFKTNVFQNIKVVVGAFSAC